MKTPATLLKSVFGYDEFRPLQAEAIEAVLGKTDTLIILPTGGGKSLCYQIPALIFTKITVVVSPLISLMQDQVAQLSEMGVAAVVLNSALPPEQYRHNMSRIRNAQVKLLYIAPESLLKESVLTELSSVGVDCLAIDEAHCISEWGHDFRPEYKQLIAVRRRFPDAACMALTATATERVRKDIQQSLGFTPNSQEFVGSFNRENLYLSVQAKQDPIAQVLDILARYPKESGIIYCQTRKQVDYIAAFLWERGLAVRPYHAGLSDGQRHAHQSLFIKDDVQIIVATIAFGMGINKPNVRFVIHFDMPKNIESYYQEIGRAGRDGIASECVLLFSYGDIQKVKYFIKDKSEGEKRIAMLQLNTMMQYAEADVCRRIILLGYFGETASFSACNMCDICRQEQKEKQDITIAAQKFLSCVKRTGERFGTAHVIDVLRGSKSQKVYKFRHDQLSTYGIGLEYSKKQWSYLSRQLVSKGLMTQNMEFGSLHLTDKAWNVFKGKEKVRGWIEEEKISRNKSNAGTEHSGYDPALFEELRQKRKAISDAANVPPYVIFSDKSLVEMATYFPQSPERLFDIYGVGQAKHEKYGEPFLNLIRAYCRKHGIEEKAKGGTRYDKPPLGGGGIEKRRHHEVGELYNTGHTVAQIMERYAVKPETIVGHLFKYASEGNQLTSPEVITLSKLSPEKRQQICDAFARHGTDFLKPIHTQFKGDISYEELHIIRLYYLYLSWKGD